METERDREMTPREEKGVDGQSRGLTCTCFIYFRTASFLRGAGVILTQYKKRVQMASFLRYPTSSSRAGKFFEE